jgi:hypothetical protein
MKKEVLIAIGVLLAGAFAAYRNFNGTPILFNNTRGLAKVDGGTVDAPAAVNEKDARAGRAYKAGLQKKPGPTLPQAATLEAPLPLRPVRGSECCPHVEAPFPTPEALRKGSSITEIRATFGPPALHVAGTREGLVEEKYFYLSPDQQRLTLINVENGHVASAERIDGPFIQPPFDKQSVQ